MPAPGNPPPRKRTKEKISVGHGGRVPWHPDQCLDCCLSFIAVHILFLWVWMHAWCSFIQSDVHDARKFASQSHGLSLSTLHNFTSCWFNSDRPCDWQLPAIRAPLVTLHLWHWIPVPSLSAISQLLRATQNRCKIGFSQRDDYRWSRTVAWCWFEEDDSSHPGGHLWHWIFCNISAQGWAACSFARPLYVHHL